MRKNQQAGVALMEVLVALLLLALGVLGFVALQYRAVEASSEGEYRVQAINLARDVAEKIRTNPTEIATYQAEIQGQAITGGTNCYNTFCSQNEKAVFDARQMNAAAQRVGMTMNMDTCPGVSNRRRCVVVAWGDTPAVSSADDPNDCTNDQGVYNATSTCVIMEAY